MLNLKNIILFATIFVSLFIFSACDPTPQTADTKTRDKQEQMQAEGEAQAGLPNIKNFTELKLVNLLYELRDKPNYVTYCYIENTVPTVAKGRTALAGKLTYVGECVGYGIPYGTQRSNPQKATWATNHGWLVLPQSEPNGLFPQPAEGTWIFLKDPNPEGKDVKPVYMESRVTVSPFKFPFD